ncbi:MAG: mannose-1-phosphate guanylyltransferase/mannose-6-phosphate isomerase [Saccharospirillaceae bacterium]|nr:mannose-1-phosphate guanylyltransferase/mannose-6-phosphate isomerase [Pseudomonadales bacterium]NRB80466.1 mannose-1-phosphate guanylyltransferase/mannose-6-phosphate isomerase [Saccharospirillaceae bacterium]
MKILPVILAGGAGNRLWPLSRKKYPKQFLKLIPNKQGDHCNTMLQDTLIRLKDLDTLPATLICNEEHRFIAAEQLRQIDLKTYNIILEPVGRNTAPAIALAAFNAIKNGEDPLLLVLAADHDIRNTEEFCKVVTGAIDQAMDSKLVTFGIVPDKAETGYGYIKRGKEESVEKECSESLVFKVDRFVEKPNLETAQQYLDSGEFYWNSGMFLFKASVYLDSLKQFAPKIFVACEKAMKGIKHDLDFIRINEEAFKTCPDDSIDYAVMEPLTNMETSSGVEGSSKVVVVPLNVGWSDVGGFASLWEITNKDKNNNVLSGDVLINNTNNCLIKSEDKIVAAVGVENLVIVSTKDAVLVVHKNNTQQVKLIVNQLKVDKRVEVDIQREIFRPWGSFDLIDKGECYQVKRILVKPGAKLTMQMHRFRAEHWIVVSGTALVKKGDEEFLLTQNESVYLPVGIKHGLHNPGLLDLKIIEVQSGTYLGEDDIVRF